MPPVATSAGARQGQPYARTRTLSAAAGKSLKLTPTLDADNFITAWTCAPDTIPTTLLPGVCRS